MIFNQVIPQLTDNSLSPIIEKTIINYTNSEVSYIVNNAFQFCHNLVSVNFPNCLSVGANAFAYNTSLETAIFPECVFLNNNAFRSCPVLTTVSFPKLQSAHVAFYMCSSLSTVSLPACVFLSGTFTSCSKLMSVYLLGSSMVTITAITFNNTPIANSTYTGAFGSIYVPSTLLEQYKANSIWSNYTDRLVGV